MLKYVLICVGVGRLFCGITPLIWSKGGIICTVSVVCYQCITPL